MIKKILLITLLAFFLILAFNVLLLDCFEAKAWYLTTKHIIGHSLTALWVFNILMLCFQIFRMK